MQKNVASRHQCTGIKEKARLEQETFEIEMCASKMLFLPSERGKAVASQSPRGAREKSLIPPISRHRSPVSCPFENFVTLIYSLASRRESSGNERSYEVRISLTVIPFFSDRTCRSTARFWPIPGNPRSR